MLQQAPPDKLLEFLDQLKERSNWLDSEEEKEMKRAAQYNCLSSRPSLSPAVQSIETTEAFLQSLLQPSIDNKSTIAKLSPVSCDQDDQNPMVGHHRAAPGTHNAQPLMELRGWSNTGSGSYPKDMMKK